MRAEAIKRLLRRAIRLDRCRSHSHQGTGLSGILSAPTRPVAEDRRTLAAVSLSANKWLAGFPYRLRREDIAIPMFKLRFQE